MIASHYAEPVPRTVVALAVLRSAPSDEAAAVRDLLLGDRFDLLDDRLGWCWGYAGDERRVGYVRSEAIGG